MSKNSQKELDKDVAVAPSKPKLQRPPMYQVIMLNDDFTPMDFVIQMLTQYFDKNSQDAEQIMWDIHYKGQGVCGIYSKELANMKVKEVTQEADHAGHPLLVEMEPIEPSPQNTSQMRP